MVCWDVDCEQLEVALCGLQRGLSGDEAESELTVARVSNDDAFPERVGGLVVGGHRGRDLLGGAVDVLHQRYFADDVLAQAQEDPADPRRREHACILGTHRKRWRKREE